MTNTRGRNGPRYRLLCRECGAALSRALAETTSEAKYRHKDGEQVIPVGFFARAENVIIKNARFYGAKDGEVLVGVADLPFALAGGSRNGCCGPTGMHGFNIMCENEHFVGTECGDCWMPHFVHLPLTHVEVCDA